MGKVNGNGRFRAIVIVCAILAAGAISVSDVSLWMCVGDIYEKIGRVPRETPPKWFIDRMDRIEDKLDRHVFNHR